MGPHIRQLAAKIFSTLQSFKISEKTAGSHLNLGLYEVMCGYNFYLSELSLSTDVMCARLFPWASLLPGPDPPEVKKQHSCNQTTLQVMNALWWGVLFLFYLDFCHNQQLQQQMWGSRFFLAEEQPQTVYFPEPFSGYSHCKNGRNAEKL